MTSSSEEPYTNVDELRTETSSRTDTTRNEESETETQENKETVTESKDERNELIERSKVILIKI